MADKYQWFEDEDVILQHFFSDLFCDGDSEGPIGNDLLFDQYPSEPYIDYCSEPQAEYRTMDGRSPDLPSMDGRSPDLPSMEGRSPDLPTSPSNSPYFDRDAELNMTHTGNLPHCHKDFTYQFVTFRLADSLPREQTVELRDRVHTFLEKHPLPWDNVTKILYSNTIGPMQERLLENGYGSCALRHPENRRILIEAIHYKENKDYDVNGYVIMPNHVHLMIRPYTKKLSVIMKSIKGYSGHMINRLMKTHGDFWMKESFDRMPRHEKDLWRILRYIKDNPRMLPPESYTLYFKEGFDPR